MAEAPVPVYADATSLIGLARIGRLDLLDLLATPVRVTSQVWQEVAADTTRPGVPALEAAHAQGLLRVVDEGDPTAFPELDAGEATVISAAAAAGAAVLLDERKARALVARNPDLHARIPATSGIVGLVLLAKRHGRLAAVRPLLDDLRRESFWMGADFYQDIVRLAGE